MKKSKQQPLSVTGSGAVNRYDDALNMDDLFGKPTKAKPTATSSNDAAFSQQPAPPPAAAKPQAAKPQLKVTPPPAPSRYLAPSQNRSTAPTPPTPQRSLSETPAAIKPRRAASPGAPPPPPKPILPRNQLLGVGDHISYASDASPSSSRSVTPSPSTPNSATPSPTHRKKALPPPPPPGALKSRDAAQQPPPPPATKQQQQRYPSTKQRYDEFDSDNDDDNDTHQQEYKSREAAAAGRKQSQKQLQPPPVPTQLQQQRVTSEQSSYSTYQAYAQQRKEELLRQQSTTVPQSLARINSLNKNDASYETESAKQLRQLFDLTNRLRNTRIQYNSAAMSVYDNDDLFLATRFAHASASKARDGDTGGIESPPPPLSPTFDPVTAFNNIGLSHYSAVNKHAVQSDQSFLTSLLESEQYATAISMASDKRWLQQQNGVAADYTNTLDSTVTMYDNQIRTFCTENGFRLLGSNEQLDAFKREINSLQQLVTTMNDELQTTGQQLLELATELQDARVVRHNVRDMQNQVHECQSVMQLLQKVVDHMTQHRYLPALKVAQNLRHQHLPRVQQYDFASLLEQQIPFIYRSIQAASKQDFDQWLVDLKPTQLEMGVNAIIKRSNHNRLEEQAARQRKAQQVENELNGNADNAVSDDDASLMSSNSQSVSVSESVDTLSDISAGMGFNFSPLYQVEHVYDALHENNEFKALYKDRRRKQLHHMLDALTPHTASPAAYLIDRYVETLGEVVGFFLLERLIQQQQTIAQLTDYEIEQLYETATSRLISSLTAIARAIKTQHTLVQLKQNAMLFAETLQHYCGYNVQQFYTFLMDAPLTTYAQLVGEEFDSTVDQILKNERYDQYVVNNVNDFRRDILPYNLQSEVASQTTTTSTPLKSTNATPAASSFPLTFAFSKSLPVILRELQLYADRMIEFIRDTTAGGNTGSANKQSVSKLIAVIEQLISVNLATRLNAVIATTSKPKFSLVMQLHTNVVTLLHSLDRWLAPYLTKAITSRIDYAAFTLPDITLESSKYAIQQLLNSIKYQMAETLSVAIDEFLSLSDAGSGGELTPSTLNTAAHDNIVDLCNYLQSTFSQLENVSTVMKQTVYGAAYSHLSAYYNNILLGSAVTRISITGLHNIYRDLQHLVEFMHSMETSNAATPQAQGQNSIAELHQLVGLFISGDVLKYATDRRTRDEYNLVVPHKIVTLIDKYRDVGLFNKLPSNVLPLKKRDLEIVQKQLNPNAIRS